MADSAFEEREREEHVGLSSIHEVWCLVQRMVLSIGTRQDKIRRNMIAGHSFGLAGRSWISDGATRLR